MMRAEGYGTCCRHGYRENTDNSIEENESSSIALHVSIRNQKQ